MEAGDFLFGVADDVEVLLPGIVAVHRLEHPGAARLDREVEGFADFGIMGHRVDELTGAIPGVGGHKPHPEVAREVRDRLQKFREVHPFLAVFAVGVDVLAEEGDLLVAGGNQFLRLPEDVLGAAGALSAPDQRDDAVGAEVVAAVHDRQARADLVLPEGRDALGDDAVNLFGVVDPPAAAGDGVEDGLVEQLRQLIEGVGAEDQVDAREGLFQFVRNLFLLGHAAAEGNQHLPPGLLLVGGLAEDAEDLLLGVFPDGTGVVEGDVGLFDRVGELAAHFGQHPFDLFAVVHILGAAERPDQRLRRAAVAGPQQPLILFAEGPLGLHFHFPDMLNTQNA